MLSYFNVMKAVDHYVAKGGSAKFIICDDGFQVWCCCHHTRTPQEPLGAPWTLAAAGVQEHAT